MSRTATATMILERYAAGERNFQCSELDAEAHDFNNTNLTGSCFSCSFIVASFRGANLSGVDFSNSNVKTCDFTNANLERARFDGAAIDAAVFDGACLIEASFVGATEQGHIYGPGELPARNAA